MVQYVLFHGGNLFVLLQIKMEISSNFSTNQPFYKWALGGEENVTHEPLRVEWVCKEIVNCPSRWSLYLSFCHSNRETGVQQCTSKVRKYFQNNGSSYCQLAWVMLVSEFIWLQNATQLWYRGWNIVSGGYAWEIKFGEIFFIAGF